MLSPESIREYLQDDERFNLLLDNKEQFSDDTIERIIEITKQQAGAIVPALINKLDKIPDVILLHGVVANLMKSESFKELRNQLQYSDANLNSISVFHKSQNYEAIAAGMKQEYSEMLKSYNTSLFLNSAWGQTSSNSQDYDIMYSFVGNSFFGML